MTEMKIVDLILLLWDIKDKYGNKEVAINGIIFDKKDIKIKQFHNESVDSDMTGDFISIDIRL